MPPAGLEPTVSASERPQTHAWVCVCSLCYRGARRTFLLCIILTSMACLAPLKFSTYSHNYLLTPWSRVLLEKLTSSAASQEIPRIFGILMFITLLTSARHLYLYWANSIQFPQAQPNSRRSILMLSPSTSRSPHWSLSLMFPHQNPVHPSPLSHPHNLINDKNFVRFLQTKYMFWNSFVLGFSHSEKNSSNYIINEPTPLCNKYSLFFSGFKPFLNFSK